MKYAPILLFCYNRLDHTRRTLKALRRNEFADRSDLFIFSDGAKTFEEQNLVNDLRKHLRSVEGFKSVTLIERRENYGLAKSIIDGVTEYVKEYDRVIVVEDDIVTSPGFLSFMNRALEYYQDDKKLWHISGWNYPIKSENLDDVFMWRAMNCWGWATWSDRWVNFEKNPNRLVQNWTEAQKKEFDLDGYNDFWSQVEANLNGEMNTWAIFWYATIFENKGLCLNPTQSFVENIGFDGSGENCEIDSASHKDAHLNQNIDINIKNDALEESSIAVELIKEFLKNKKSLRSRLVRLLRRGVKLGR
jgi:hypothetical protein